jgi:hypothetical protein
MLRNVDQPTGLASINFAAGSATARKGKAAGTARVKSRAVSKEQEKRRPEELHHYSK